MTCHVLPYYSGRFQRRPAGNGRLSLSEGLNELSSLSTQSSPAPARRNGAKPRKPAPSSRPRSVQQQFSQPGSAQSSLATTEGVLSPHSCTPPTEDVPSDDGAASDGLSPRPKSARESPERRR